MIVLWSYEFEKDSELPIYKIVLRNLVKQMTSHFEWPTQKSL